MTDAADFLAAITDQPDDDLPRLVYADFLEEAGDADRAEFIRVQCELARTPGPHPDRPALVARESELLRVNKPRWVIAELGGKQVFRRGFVESVRTTAQWLIAASAGLARTPLRELRLQSADGYADELARLPVLSRVVSLDLTNNSFPTVERILAEAPLAALRRLTARNIRMWPEGLQSLARSPVVARLQRLNLSGNPVSDAGMETLATNAAFAGLTELVARADEQYPADCVHANGAAALAQSRVLTRLRLLDLGGHYIGDAGLSSLVRSPNVSELAELDVPENEIGDIGESGIEALVESPHLGRLKRLNLVGNRISTLAARALAGWPRLRDGVRVDLRGCEMDDYDSAASELLASRYAAQFLTDF
jgi:uncharacterized protein (TIGR02996 family)